MSQPLEPRHSPAIDPPSFSPHGVRRPKGALILAMARILHVVGAILFLGSVLVFVVASSLTMHGSLSDLVFARRLISQGSAWLTFPGAWILVVTGAWLSARRHGFLRSGWMGFKQMAGLLLLTNGYALISPAAKDCLSLAHASLAHGTLVAGYSSAYMRESIAGSFNVILGIVSLSIAILRPWDRREVGV